MKNLTFLCYMSRSGSTFLAKELNKFDDIKVGIEGDFYDGFHRPFSLLKDDLELKNYINDALNNTFSKFNYWQIDKEKLFSKLRIKYPVSFCDFLLSALELYFKSVNDNEIIVHKAGGYHKYIDKVIKEFGVDVKFIFINRDPRSIYNSQKKTLGSESEIPFVSNIETFVFRYKREHELLGKYIDNKQLFMIYYEDLILNKDYTINKIINFIGSNGNLKKHTPNYLDKIPAIQQKIHKNLKKEEDVSRIAPWKKELSLKTNYLLEKHLIKYFNIYGYEKLAISNKQKILLYFAYLISKGKYLKNQIIIPELRKHPRLYRFYKVLIKVMKLSR